MIERCDLQSLHRRSQPRHLDYSSKKPFDSAGAQQHAAVPALRHALSINMAGTGADLPRWPGKAMRRVCDVRFDISVDRFFELVWQPGSKYTVRAQHCCITPDLTVAVRSETVCRKFSCAHMLY